MESYIHLYGTNSEFTEAYNRPDYKEPWLSLTEENMEVNYNKPPLTAITFNSITWKTDVPATGGTATKDNCTFEVYGNYEDGTSADISSIVTVEGELVVPSSTADQRQEVGQLTLTASYGGFSATGSVTAYQEAFDLSMEPLTFNILSAGTINWTVSKKFFGRTIDYKLNNNKWTSITSNTGSSAPTITVNPGDKLQFKGNNEQYATSSYYNSFSGSTALFEVEGNIMSLIYGDEFKNKLTISSTSALARLFKGCTKLVSAENLILPATTLASNCYQQMFDGCTSLTKAPELPATTLVTACYNSMFYNCKSLTTAPELPATPLAYGCYVNIFKGCTSLTIAPKLPATTLAELCYNSMFDGCTSLITAPELPATTLAKYCYDSMFRGCTSLTTAPALPATTLVTYCYQNMFSGCTSLTIAPELPATALTTNCYNYMFNGCASLNYIKCLATDISASGCTNNWVSGVASTGTFVKASSMTSWATGTSGIPTGWAVQDA